MRNALARTLYELAKEDHRIVVIVADISPAGAMDDFRREFPDRFINVGVAEQAMIGLAAGLAQRGLRPFCYTIAPFALFRPYEFIRCDLAYQRLPVTVVGMGAGLSYSTLGGTHQAIEDIAVALACPGMTVLAPCDPAETEACARWCASREAGGPVYLRIGKSGEPDLTGTLYPWIFGLPRWFAVGRSPDTLMASYGPIALEASRAAEALGYDFATFSTLSRVPIYAVSGYERIVTVEEAVGAPLGSSLARAVSSLKWDMRVESLDLMRDFSRAHGTRHELLERAGLTTEKIVAALS